MARRSASKRGYDARWRKARERYLAEHPFCDMCEERGQVERATVVDHKIPHRGDPALFWDRDNWQGLCQTDHSATKQAMEATGVLRGCDEDGVPLDPAHRWRQAC